jgi:hypothetical protein
MPGSRSNAQGSEKALDRTVNVVDARTFVVVSKLKRFIPV